MLDVIFKGAIIAIQTQRDHLAYTSKVLYWAQSTFLQKMKFEFILRFRKLKKAR
jgi:hypothetical protein